MGGEVEVERLGSLTIRASIRNSEMREWGGGVHRARGGVAGAVGRREGAVNETAGWGTRALASKGRSVRQCEIK